jgi:hypothetical protein
VTLGIDKEVQATLNISTIVSMMASAFVETTSPIHRQLADGPTACTLDHQSSLSKNCSLESETEDEEVKMNCVGGLRGVDDSDINTTERSDADDDDSSDEEGPCTERYAQIALVFLVDAHTRCDRKS